MAPIIISVKVSTPRSSLVCFEKEHENGSLGSSCMARGFLVVPKPQHANTFMLSFKALDWYLYLPGRAFHRHVRVKGASASGYAVPVLYHSRRRGFFGTNSESLGNLNHIGSCNRQNERQILPL